MGNIVDFDKGREKVLKKKRAQEVEKKKATFNKVSKNYKRNTSKATRVAVFYGLLFSAIFIFQVVSQSIIN